MFENGFVEVGACFALVVNAEHEVARLAAVFFVADDDVCLFAHLDVPVLDAYWEGMRQLLSERFRAVAPSSKGEGEFIGGTSFSRLPASGPRRSPADLLPVRACLFVPHQKVLVVDSGQVEGQLQAVTFVASTPDRCDRAFNTWRRWERRPHVVHDVVVRDAPDRIGASGAVPIRPLSPSHRHRVDLANGRNCRFFQRMEHLFVDVDPGEGSAGDSEDGQNGREKFPTAGERGCGNRNQ